AATDYGGGRPLVEAIDKMQTNLGGEPCIPRPLLGGHFEGWPRLGGVDRPLGSVAGEPVFSGVAAGLNLVEADVQFRVATGGEGEDAGDMNGTNHFVSFTIVDDAMTRANLHARAGGGEFAALPRFGVRPRTAGGGADQRRRGGFGLLGKRGSDE